MRRVVIEVPVVVPLTGTVPGAGASLFTVDVLPARCEVTVEMQLDDNGCLMSMRFVATDADGRRSVPSGWFRWEGDPIVVTWAAFEWAA